MSNNISLPRLLFPSNSNTKHHHVLPLLLLTLSPPPLALSQNGTALSAPPPINQNPSMAIIMAVLLTSCFLTGFFSICVHQCANRHGHRHSSPSVVAFASGRHSLGIAEHGLEPKFIESFPTFLYSSVKGHKINKAVSLECAVCLNEFEDEETLHLIPKCCHAFHPVCIGSWLSSHTTCPICRADLTPKAGEVIIKIPMISDRCVEDHKSTEVESIRVSAVDQEARAEAPRRSRSTGHGMRLARVFNYLPGLRSTGHLVVRPGEDCERFTMQLPEELMRNHEMMRRTKSCMAFPRESSHRSGYRTVSNRWTLAALSGRFSLDRSRRGAEWDEESGETSSDRLRLNPKGDSQGQRLEF